MPYIPSLRRDFLDNLCVGLFETAPDLDMGELNYVVTKLLLETQPKRYVNYNELVGLLECVKLEFYRRAVSRYETEKMKENGDVYL